MNAEKKLLWSKIESFKLDKDDVELSFSERLSRENGWTAEYTEDVISEYRKFIFLCTVSNEMITPSDAVDQAWHLHLTYSQSYWKELCAEILRKEIHHNPTKGGLDERSKFEQCYDLTFELYWKYFNQEAPAHVWLNADNRFNNINFQRVNLSNYWVIKKPSRRITKLSLLVIASLSISFLFINSDNGSPWLGLILIVVALLIIFGNKRRGKKRRGGGSSGSGFSCSGCNWGNDSGCGGGGCGGGGGGE